MKYVTAILIVAIVARAVLTWDYQRAEARDDHDKAALYARVLAACANGQGFAIGEHVIQCKPIAK